jgi:hypothetical protein
MNNSPNISGKIKPIPKGLTSEQRVSLALARINSHEYGDGVLIVTADKLMADLERTDRDDSGHVEAEEIAYDAANVQDRWDGGAL